MDIERALVSKTINAGLIEYVISRNIKTVHFEDPNGENAQVFRTLVAHFDQYSAPPSQELVMARHPNYRLDVSTDVIDSLLDDFIRKVKRREMQKALIDVAGRIDNRDEQLDLEMVLFEAAEQVASIVPSSRVSRLSDVPQRIELLRRRMREGRIPGVQLGWPSIDNETLGIQGPEMVVFAAFSNGGKSTILQYSCLAGYLTDPSFNGLMISLEMDAGSLLRKFDAMATSIQLWAIKAMDMGREALPDAMMYELERWAERASRAPNNIVIIDDIPNCTVERVMAETMRWKPSATYTDYLQYMDGSGDNSYTKVGNIAKGLKRIARLTGIPQITAAQTTRGAAREGVKEDNIADSIEIYRSADWMFGIERDEELDAEKSARLKIVKARDGKKGVEIKIGFDFDTMDFGERSTFMGRATPPPIVGARGPVEVAPPVFQTHPVLAPPLVVPSFTSPEQGPVEASPNGHAVLVPSNPFAVLETSTVDTNPFAALVA